jgi:hypothetical protein
MARLCGGRRAVENEWRRERWRTSGGESGGGRVEERAVEDE